MEGREEALQVSVVVVFELSFKALTSLCSRRADRKSLQIGGAAFIHLLNLLSTYYFPDLFSH